MMAAAGVRSASVSPSLLAVLDPAGLGGLGSVLVGSERVGRDVVAAWAPGRRLAIGYGPTEATVISSTAVADPGAAGDPPIGCPVPGTRVYVADKSLRPVPAGVLGELLVGGAQVARGMRGARR